jgi:hypothetical protein
MEDRMWKNIAVWLNENCTTRKEPQLFGINWTISPFNSNTEFLQGAGLLMWISQYLIMNWIASLWVPSRKSIALTN